MSNNLFLATGDTVPTVQQMQEAAEWQQKQGVLSYGGLVTDCLADILEQKGFPVQKDEICPDDDDSIGLRMPEVWYLNKGPFALNIPLYYNFLQNKVKVYDNTITKDNMHISAKYGKTALVEIITQKNLVNSSKNARCLITEQHTP